MLTPTDEEIIEDLVKAGLAEPPDPNQPKYKEEEYITWSPTKTHVVSGPLGPAVNYPGTRYENWRLAETGVREKHNVVAFWTLGQRWFARVRSRV